MKTYKGFDKDLKCRGFQYEIGGEYETDKAECCKEGFHACENPLDVFSYYPPAGNRFCEVEQSGEVDKSDDDSKVASTKIKIGAEIGLSGIIKAAIEFNLEHAEKRSSSSGYRSVSSSSGDQSVSSSSGYRSVSEVSGNDSVALAAGYQSKARASIGSAIVVCERGQWNGKTYPLIGIKAAIVDGTILKADTFYTLKNGEFQEVSEE